LKKHTGNLFFERTCIQYGAHPHKRS